MCSLLVCGRACATRTLWQTEQQRYEQMKRRLSMERSSTSASASPCPSPAPAPAAGAATGTHGAANGHCPSAQEEGKQQAAAPSQTSGSAGSTAPHADAALAHEQSGSSQCDPDGTPSPPAADHGSCTVASGPSSPCSAAPSASSGAVAVEGSPPVPPASRAAVPGGMAVERPAEPDIVTRVFGGQLASLISCCECGYTSVSGTAALRCTLRLTLGPTHSRQTLVM